MSCRDVRCDITSIKVRKTDIGHPALTVTTQTRPLQNPRQGATLCRGACPVGSGEPGVGRRRRTTGAEPDCLHTASRRCAVVS